MNIVSLISQKVIDFLNLKKELQDDYDWQQVFCCASNNQVYDSDGNKVHCENVVSPTAVLSNSTISTVPFNIDDVSEIIGYCAGQNDEEDWLIAGKLHDGRYFMIEAGCDYTGWD